MKQMTLILSIFLVLFIVYFTMNTKVEGLCGNYTLSYYKVKDLFAYPNVSGLKQAFNTHFTRDLISNCL